MRINVLTFLIAVPFIILSEFLFHLTHRKTKVVRVFNIVKMCCVLIEEELLPLLCIKVW